MAIMLALAWVEPHYNYTGIMQLILHFSFNFYHSSLTQLWMNCVYLLLLLPVNRSLKE